MKRGLQQQQEEDGNQSLPKVEAADIVSEPLHVLLVAAMDLLHRG
jgi:hypothetical protein